MRLGQKYLSNEDLGCDEKADEKPETASEVPYEIFAKALMCPESYSLQSGS